jgi:hypothetical protein
LTRREQESGNETKVERDGTSATTNKRHIQQLNPPKKKKKKKEEEEGRSRAETRPEIARRVFLGGWRGHESRLTYKPTTLPPQIFFLLGEEFRQMPIFVSNRRRDFSVS